MATTTPSKGKKAAGGDKVKSAPKKARAQKPTAVYEKDWAGDTWARGCPVGVMAPGTLYDFGPTLRAPLGKIHWAGTETSDYWAGYMDGAVRSGERAAAEVVAAL